MTPEQEARVDQIPVAPIALEPVQSSQIAAIGHDDKTNTLAIRFKPRAGSTVGPLYHYANVDRGIYNNMKAAPSIGSFFHNVIKPDTASFPYRRVQDEAAAQSA
jgi:hypothetical protein